MKKLLLLLAILSVVVGKSQTLTSWDEIKTQRFGKLTIYKTKKDKPLDGDYKIASESGRYSVIHFNEGKIDGKRKDYNSNDELTCLRNYSDGLADGKWEYYDTQNGDVETLEHYKKGKKHGKWWKKMSSTDGYFIKTSFYKEDIPTGTWTEKWQNGNLKEERIYSGKGTYQLNIFHDNGKLYEHKSYKDFKLNGIQQKYSKAGVLLVQELYKDDLLEKSETFFDSGKPYKIYSLKNGKPHGEYVFYRSSGHKSMEGTFNNGLKEGVVKDYGYNGWLHYETTYENDVENGMFKEYHQNGKVKEKGNYQNGEKDGLWELYDETGKLIEKRVYQLGIKVSSENYE